MARIWTEQITADGDITVPLKNHRRGTDQSYTVVISGGFGSGTVTAFVNADGTNDVAIKDAGGTAISLTAGDSFNFVANSDATNPLKLVITTASSTTPTINVNVYDAA